MGEPEDVTATAFVKRLAKLCEEHGRVKVSVDDEDILVIKGWAVGEPVRCRIKGRT